MAGEQIVVVADFKHFSDMPWQTPRQMPSTATQLLPVNILIIELVTISTFFYLSSIHTSRAISPDLTTLDHYFEGDYH